MNDDQQQDSQSENQSLPPKDPEFQLGGVSREALSDDDDRLDAQSPPVPRQTLVVGLQDEHKQSDDPSRPGKTTLVIGQEYQQDIKRQKPINYTTASQQAAEENKLSPLVKLMITLGMLIVLTGIVYVVYLNLLSV